MKSIGNMKGVAGVLVLLALAGQTVRADENMVVVRYNAQPTGSKVTMDGTSTIHDWTVVTPLVGGYMEVAEGFPECALTNDAATKPGVQVIIPVRTLKSYATKMDEVMQEHLNMAQYPKIEYHVLALKPASPAGTTGKVGFEATGTLSVSGVTRTNVMPVTIDRFQGGAARAFHPGHAHHQDRGRHHHQVRVGCRTEGKLGEPSLRPSPVGRERGNHPRCNSEQSGLCRLTSRSDDSAVRSI